MRREPPWSSKSAARLPLDTDRSGAGPDDPVAYLHCRSNHMKKIISLSLYFALFQGLVCLGPTTGAVFAQEAFTNEKVIDMVKAGVPEEKIIGLIQNSPGKYDLSAAGQKDLAIAGVPATIIAAMEKRHLPRGTVVSPSPPDNPGGTTGGRRIVVPLPFPGLCETCLRYRVVVTGFRVNTGTIDGHLITDGRGDEVFVAANVAELVSNNRLASPVTNKRSVNYGDTDGRGNPVRPIGIDLLRASPNPTFRAGSASSTTGGLLSGDRFPNAGETASPPRDVRAALVGRFIPMTLWEGDLHPAPNPNAVILFPTIWENDNIPDMWQIWNTQAAAWLGRYARASSRDVNGSPTARTALLQVESDVMTTIPQINNFDRPIGIQGGAYDPLSATPDPATFSPQSLFLTAETAEAAVARGDIQIRYEDGPRYGPGSYTLILRIERVSR